MCWNYFGIEKLSVVRVFSEEFRLTTQEELPSF